MRLPPALTALLALATGLCPCRGDADANRLRFRHLTVEDGLSNAWVRAILRDSRGFVWFGTADGLDRYDGSRIVHYRGQPGVAGSLASSQVTALFEDSQQRLWVGLGGGPAGIALYDRHRDAFERFALDVSSLPRQRLEVHQIREARDHRLWIAATNGLQVLRPGDRQARLVWQPPASPEYPAEHPVSRSLEDALGRFWLATTTGFYWYDPSTSSAVRWSPDIGGRDPSSVGVSDMLLDGHGSLWCALTRHGLLRVDSRTLQSHLYASDPSTPGRLGGDRLQTLAADGNGRIYVGTEDAGLAVLEVASGRFTSHRPDPGDPASLAANSVDTILTDEQDSLWVGTYNGGVDYSSPFERRFELLQARAGQLGNPNVTSVIQDRRGDLWIGTDGGGIDRLERRSGRFTRYRHDPANEQSLLSDAVLALFEDRPGNIWIGTYAGGLQSLDPRTNRFVSYRHDPSRTSSLPDTNVFRIVEDRRGRLVLSTLRSAPVCFDRASGGFSPLLPERETRDRPWFPETIVEAADGSLWIGSDEVRRFDQGTGALTRYRLGAGDVHTILEDSRHNLWFGTKTGGLVCLERGTGRLRRFTSADGLPSDNVSGVQEDEDGNLWLGTARGLVRFEAAVELPSAPRFVTFDARDGLQGYEFRRGATFKSRSGELFFGGEGGLSFFNPGQLPLNRRPPRPTITEAVVATRSGSQMRLPEAGGPGAEVVLSTEDPMVTFGFAAQSFVLPQKNRFQYRLEGFDPSWSPATSERSITYTNLPAGRYRFALRAASNDGAWSESEATIAVRKLPPVYETWWFATGMVAGAAVAAMAFHRLRIRRHVRTEAVLQTRFEQAVAEIKTLGGLLPMCAWCRKVRDDSGYWHQIEAFLAEHTDIEFDRGECPTCAGRSARQQGPRR